MHVYAAKRANTDTSLNKIDLAASNTWHFIHRRQVTEPTHTQAVHLTITCDNTIQTRYTHTQNRCLLLPLLLPVTRKRNYRDDSNER